MVKLWSEVMAVVMRGKWQVVRGGGGSGRGGDDSVRREKVLCRKRAANYTSGKTIFAV